MLHVRTILIGSFCLLSLYVSPSSARSELSLDGAVEQALNDNPGLAAIQARSEALSHIPDQQESLPDPILSLRMANLPLDTGSTTQEGMTQMQVGLTQKLPYLGKLGLRAQSAKQESQAAFADVDEQRLLLVRDVKTVWWNIFFIDRALEVVNRNQELLRQFVTIAQTKYKVGKGLQQDVLLSQLELSKLLDAKIDLDNKRHNQVAKLNTLLNVPPEKSITLPTTVPSPLPKLLPLVDLQVKAQNARPLLVSQHKKLDAAKTRVELAHKDYYPDFSVGAVYGYRNGDDPDGSSRSDFGSFGVTMSLPFFDTTSEDSRLSQRNQEKIQRSFQLHNSRNLVANQVSTGVSDFQQMAEKADLFAGGIIPQAKQTVDSMLAGYQVNKVDFLNLIRVQTSLYNYETKYWRAISSANQALARLAAAVGEENIHE